MKRFYKKVFKSKKPSLGSLHGSGPATSTLITSSTDLIPSESIHASDTTASTQVQVTDGAVSVQPRPLHL